jgi:hypothetical protein
MEYMCDEPPEESRKMGKMNGKMYKKMAYKSNDYDDECDILKEEEVTE